jgi:DeoR family glycerol-3-phosphate regulon repressor
MRDFDPREVKVAQAIIEQSREVWLVADYDKFSRQAMVKLAHLSEIDRLFCDAAPPQALSKMLADAHVEVVIAS